ncbi:hypothetical protein ABW21_db0201589 [Orbilia brochopaga]|nr:hypothetical protein ABW21_db0201589 [Drechslerella brochopaga]
MSAPTRTKKGFTVDFTWHSSTKPQKPAQSQPQAPVQQPAQQQAPVQNTGDAAPAPQGQAPQASGDPPTGQPQGQTPQDSGNPPTGQPAPAPATPQGTAAGTAPAAQPAPAEQPAPPAQPAAEDGSVRSLSHSSPNSRSSAKSSAPTARATSTTRDGSEDEGGSEEDYRIHDPYMPRAALAACMCEYCLEMDEKQSEQSPSKPPKETAGTEEETAGKEEEEAAKEKEDVSSTLPSKDVSNKNASKSETSADSEQQQQPQQQANPQNQVAAPPGTSEPQPQAQAQAPSSSASNASNASNATEQAQSTAASSAPAQQNASSDPSSIFDQPSALRLRTSLRRQLKKQYEDLLAAQADADSDTSDGPAEGSVLRESNADEDDVAGRVIHRRRSREKKREQVEDIECWGTPLVKVPNPGQSRDRCWTPVGDRMKRPSQQRRQERLRLELPQRAPPQPSAMVSYVFAGDPLHIAALRSLPPGDVFIYQSPNRSAGQD